MDKSIIGACVKNDLGDLLVCTTRHTMQQCEEDAIEFYGETSWNILKSRGTKVIQIEIKEISE